MRAVFLGIVIACFAIIGSAQNYTDIKYSELPKTTQDYVKVNLAGLDITRTVKIEDNGKTNYGVVFESRGAKHVLIFDKDGNYLQKGDDLFSQQAKPKNEEVTPAVPATANKTTTAISPDQLPANAKDYIKTSYPSSKIVTAAQFSDKKAVFYQVQVTDGSKNYMLTFDSKGNFLSKRYYTAPAEQPKK
jgi:hypothetical protein